MMIRKWFNDNMGAMIATGVIAIVCQSIFSYAHALRTDDKLLSFEKFAQQQQAMNDAQIRISESVAVLASRMTYFEKDLDRVFANMPAATGGEKN